MIWLRFYYFSFLYFYRKKGKDWDAWKHDPPSLILVYPQEIEDPGRCWMYMQGA